MTRVTLGKSRVRESRMPGSVRAKPNGLATRPPPLFGFLIDRVGTGALAGSAGLGLASTAALLCCACHTSGGCQHRASPALSICACSAAGLVGWALRGLVMSVPSTLSRDPQHHYCKPGYIINNHGTPKSLLSADLTVPKWRFATAEIRKLSAHAWARLGLQVEIGGEVRFIRACVGATTICNPGGRKPSVHPHPRGRDVMDRARLKALHRSIRARVGAPTRAVRPRSAVSNYLRPRGRNDW